MAAYEEKVPVDEEAEQRQRSMMEEYKQKLIVCGNVMSDPFSLHDGWQNGQQFIIRTLRNFFAKSVSHQTCYYVWSQTIRKAKHTDIINLLPPCVF